MELPLEILQVGDQRVYRTEQTRDISSAGVCFLSPHGVEIGGRIEYIITLSRRIPPVRIRCLGKVIRSYRASSAGDSSYEVAVSMERYCFVRETEASATEAAAISV